MPTEQRSVCTLNLPSCLLPSQFTAAAQATRGEKSGSAKCTAHVNQVALLSPFVHAMQEAAAAQLIAVATAAAQDAGISSSSLRNLQRLQSQASGKSPETPSGLTPEVTKSNAVLHLLRSDASELNAASDRQHSTWDHPTSQLDAMSSGNEQSGATHGDRATVSDHVRVKSPHQNELWTSSPWTVPSKLASIAVYHQQQDQQQHPKQSLVQQAEQQQQPKQSLLKQRVSDQAPDTPHQFELHHQQLQQQQSVLSTASGIAPDAPATATHTGELWLQGTSWDQSAADGVTMLQQSAGTVTQTEQSGGSLTADAMLRLSGAVQSDLGPARGSAMSSAMPQLRDGMLGVEQEDAARAAYRQWSDSFEASQVSIALLSG